jgi:replicative DNA helicase
MDQQLERKFLVHIVKNPNASLQASEAKITPEYFQWRTSGILFRGILFHVRNYGTIPTYEALVSILSENNIAEELQKSVVTLYQELLLENNDEDFGFLCDELIKYHKQALIEASIRKSVELLAEKKLDQATEILKNDLAKIEQKFRTVVPRSGQLDEFATGIKEEFLDKKVNPQKYQGIKLGYPSIDRFMGGLTPGSVTLVLAPPKGFKSALAMNITHNIAKQGTYCYWVANEGVVEMFYMRYAAMELSIPLSHIKNNEMDAMEESRWLAFIGAVESGKHPVLNNIYFDEIPSSICTPEFIEERIKKLNEDGKNVGFVVIDHFGRMTTADKVQVQDWQIKGKIAQQICGIALSTRIPFFLLTHVKAASAKEALQDDKDFDAYDIERSGQPLKDVDAVFSWKINDQVAFDRNGKKGWARLSLVLSRHSETGSADFEIDGKYMRIREITVGGSSQQSTII